VGLTLAATLLLSGFGQELNPFQNTADGSRVPTISEALSNDPAVPEARTDDDFFAPATGAPEDTDPPADTAPEPQGAQVTASSASEDEEDETAPEAEDSREPDRGDGNGDRGNSDSDESGNSGSPQAAGGPMTGQVVDLVNGARADAGCDPLHVDNRLVAAAQEHSEDMDARDYMAHESPEGEGPGDRARRHGYDSWGAENVAKGQTSPEQVMDAWLNSPGHRANILNCGLVAIGVGESGNAWTQMFGWE
jgi:uncharacterized protein YkwD